MREKFIVQVKEPVPTWTCVPGRPKKPIEIANEDLETLRTIVLRPKSAQAVALRARIVLYSGAGLRNSEIARQLHITGATVGKWRERFRMLGVQRLYGVRVVPVVGIC